MLQRLVTRLRHAATRRDARPRTPEDVRIYAVGDVHGRADLLHVLLAQIEADASGATASRKLLIYLGDYVDRGLESREVIETLLSGPPPGFEALYLKGNHEQALLRFLEDPGSGSEWRHIGGIETLHSYGVTDLPAAEGDGFEAARAELWKRLPASHRAFLGRLRLSASFGDYFFVHAGLRPGIPLRHQQEQDLLGIRGDFLDARVRFGKVVVHGHCARREPERLSGRINVDTGAYLTNNLTCVMLDGEEQRFLQTQESVG